jgi:hypothetical protein
MTCPVCAVRPGAHSFAFVHEVNERPVFYTCPATATEYWDGPGIVAHVECVWAAHGAPPRWHWTFDAQDFGFRHVMEFGVARDVLDLFQSGRVGIVEKIVVKNANQYLQWLLVGLRPFMNQSFLERIVV